MTQEPIVLAPGFDIDSLPRGLYDTGERDTRDCYDPLLDVFHKNMPCKLLMRIRPPGDIPPGVDELIIRRNGDQVIKVWVLQ